MYRDHFGLRSRPFEDRADIRFFHATAEAEEALATMEYEAEYGRGIALVVGEAGTGKTLLIRTLLHKLAASDHVVVLTWPPDGRMDLVRETAKGFGVSLPSSHNATRCLARLRRHLTRTRQADHRSILFVDQAENLTAESMTQLGTLMELQGGEGRLLNIILAGQPRIRSTLTQPQFASVAQQLYGERVLSPLTCSEAREYIRHRLRVAGAADVDLFDHDVVELIHRASKGIPRLINHVCDAAMLAAYGAGTTRIDHGIAVEVVGRTHLMERSLQASELGMATAEQVAAGLRSEVQVPSTVGVDTAGAARTSASLAVAEPLHRPAETDWDTWSIQSTADERCDADSDRAASVAADDLDDSAGFERYADVMGDEVAQSSPVKGEVLLEKLQQALARAERISATTEASLGQFTAIEKHLITLTRNAERLTAGLATGARRATETADSLQQSLKHVFEEGEARIQAVETRLSRVSKTLSEAQEETRRVQNACEHGDQVESRLTSFAERLADKADEVQKRMTLLMSGLETSETVREQLDGMVKEASVVTNDAGKRIETLRAAIEHTKGECERLGREYMESHETEFRARLQKQLDTHERKLAETLETARREISEAALKSTAIVTGVQEKVDGLRAAFEQVDSQVDGLRGELTDRTIATTVAQLRAKLQEHVDEEKRALAQVAENAHSRLADAAQENISMATEAEKRVHLLRTALAQTESELERLQQQSADDVLQRSKQKLQERFDAYLREQEGVADAATAAHRTKLEQALEEFTPHVRSLQDAIAGARKESGEIRADCERLRMETCDEACEQVNRLRQQVGNLKTQRREVESSLVTLSEQTDATSARVDDLTQAVSATESAVEQLAQRAEAVRTGLSPLVQQGENLLGGVLDARGQVEALQHSVAGMLFDVGSACERARAARDQIAQYEQVLGRLNSQTTDGEATAAQLKEAAADARQLLQGMQEAIAHADGKMERFDSQAAACGELLGRLAEHAAQAGELVEQSRVSSATLQQVLGATDEQAAQLAALQAGSENSARRIEDLVTSAKQLHDAVQGVVAHAEEKMTRLNSHHAAATHLLRRLSEANTAGHGLIEQANGVTQAAEQAVGNLKTQTGELARELSEQAEIAQAQDKELAARNAGATDLIDKLAVMTESAWKTAAELTQRSDLALQHTATLADGCGKAGEITDQLRTLTQVLHTANEKEQGIRTATEEAYEAIERLTAAGSDAVENREALEALATSVHGLVETHEQLKRQTQTEAERLTAQQTQAGQLVRELSEQAEIAQAQGTELTARNAGATDLIEKLAAITESARKTAAELAQRTDLAVQHTATLADGCGQAGEIADQLRTLTQVLYAANEKEQGIRTVTEEAHTAIERLTAAGSDSVENREALEALATSVHGLVETHKQLKHETQTEAERLTAQLSTVRNLAEAGEPLIGEFVSRARAVEGKLEELQAKAVRIEQILTQASVRPAEILESSHAQAAELERVCAAVRKVFGGLSQATLEAHKRSDECKQASDEMSKQITVLRTEAGRAAHTMHEWVEEAVRVQSRLERTLQLCPPIGETHPGNTLTRMSKLLRSSGQIANSSALGTLETLKTPSFDESAVREAEPPTAVDRAGEISRLIADAKQAAAR